MPVNTPHKEYECNVGKWERDRDCFAGSDAVKNAGVKYLPKLDSHYRYPKKYDDYKARALFYNAMGRTVEGLAGAIFQKEPAFNFPDAIKEHEKDITLNGVPAELFGLRTTKDVFTTGRYGAMVELPAEEEKQPRPYWCGYAAENIISWRTEYVDGEEVLTRVVLREMAEEPDPKDDFVTVCIEQYKVLELVDEGAGPVYVQNIWRKMKEDGKEVWKIVETYYPTRRKENLTFIPFVFFGPTTNSAEVEKPPLDDLAVLNLAHYRAMADYKHGLHYTALPQPWVAGMAGTTTNQPLAIGSGNAWQLAENGKAGMLEFSGAGLKAIRDDLQDMQKMMATLGARLLEEAPSSPETMGAVGMRHAGEHATIRTICQTIEQGLTRLLQWHIWWVGTAATPQEVTEVVELNKEFFQVKATAEEIKTLMLLWQGGGISWETFYYKLQTGGWSRDGIDAEEEKEAIETEVEEEREKHMQDIEDGLVPDPAAPPQPPQGGNKPPAKPPAKE